MHCAERRLEGGYRVYAAALETDDCTGFHAAVVVRRRLDVGASHINDEVFRDVQLKDGAVWDKPGDALVVALCAGIVVAHQVRESSGCVGSET